jgi:hypothetical protein
MALDAAKRIAGAQETILASRGTKTSIPKTTVPIANADAKQSIEKKFRNPVAS